MAEALRDRETRKAVRLQSAHRGRTLRLEVAHWNAMALTIERCTRGHLGRQQARRLRIARDTRRQRAFFDALATTVQKRFRAYHARKYRHNFYARQAYVASVLRKGDMVRDLVRVGVGVRGGGRGRATWCATAARARDRPRSRPRSRN